MRARRNDALRRACEHGQLPTAQWLVAAFGLTADDAHDHGNYALYWSCQNDHAQVAQWLLDLFGSGARF